HDVDTISQGGLSPGLVCSPATRTVFLRSPKIEPLKPDQPYCCSRCPSGVAASRGVPATNWFLPSPLPPASKPLAAETAAGNGRRSLLATSTLASDLAH